MPLNYEFLTGLELGTVEQVITDRDAMFYALSIGIGRDPVDKRDLRFTFENNLIIFPTMPVVVGHPANWMSDPKMGITANKMLHGAQIVTNLAPLEVGQRIVARNRVTGVSDKGADRGAILKIERTLRDSRSGKLHAILESLVFCRADGGFGGDAAPIHEFRPIPIRQPEIAIAVETPANAALVYRLNNDRNPIHADPAVAVAGGFDRPILHGLATFGMSINAVAKAFDDQNLKRIECRFSHPVLPGENMIVEIWAETGGASFRTRVGNRTVIDNGHVLFGGSSMTPDI